MPHAADIKIMGESEFIARTEKALALLRAKVPSTYRRWVRRYVKEIRTHGSSGMNLWAKVPTFEVGKRTWKSSVTWYASVIAHESLHARLYFDYRRARSGKVPRRIYNNPKVELRCIRYQASIGRRIGMPKSELRYLMSLDGSHSKMKKIDW